MMRPWRPGFELNLEGYPDRRFLDIVAEIKPEQCTLVPDSPDAFTSEEGWKLDAAQHRLVDRALSELKLLGCRVSCSSTPIRLLSRRCATPAPMGRIYTGGYAAAFGAGDPATLRDACAATAQRAAALGLVVNIGHDLNLDNLPPLVAALPGFAEASIGHELTADALVMGFAAAVRAYRAALNGGN